MKLEFTIKAGDLIMPIPGKGLLVKFPELPLPNGASDGDQYDCEIVFQTTAGKKVSTTGKLEITSETTTVRGEKIERNFSGLIETSEPEESLVDAKYHINVMGKISNFSLA